MANTTNFGWETPDDTDLVKDGAAAMRTLGNSIDTSFVDLKGGTTGQILSKASNTDLDYTWINNDQGDITEVVAGTGISGGGTSGSVTVTNSMATAIDAKGDLIAGTGADAFARLGVGTDGQLLTASSAAATGLAWTTLAAGSLTELASTTFNNTTSSYDITSISASYTHLVAIGSGLQLGGSTDISINIKINNDSGANYAASGIVNANGTIQNFGGHVASSNQWPTGRCFGFTTDASSRFGQFYVVLPLYSSTSVYKAYNSMAWSGASGLPNSSFATGFWNSTSAINQVTFSSANGNTIKAGRIVLYGVK